MLRQIILEKLYGAAFSGCVPDDDGLRRIFECLHQSFVEFIVLRSALALVIGLFPMGKVMPEMVRIMRVKRAALFDWGIRRRLLPKGRLMMIKNYDESGLIESVRLRCL